jgi:uncharacterized membrane protein YeaQ/YmgE (transglycosylase-associated protein family)
MGIVAWLLVGLIAGFIARALVPGKDSMGVLGTMLLGLVGSVIGGLIGNALSPGDQMFSPAGLIGSIIGAIIALVAYRAMGNRSRTVTR